MSKGLRLHGHLHAGGGQEPPGQRHRRAEREQPAGPHPALRRSRGCTGRQAAPTRGTARRSPASSRSRDSPSRRCSSSARGCRSRSSTGVDLNRDSVRNDIPERAYQFTDVGQAPKDIGACETWNCGRGAWRTQINLRVSRSFRLYRNCPDRGDRRDLQPASTRRTRRASSRASTWAPGAPNPDFMQPTEFAGDFQNPEQRVGQIGFRFSF